MIQEIEATAAVGPVFPWENEAYIQKQKLKRVKKIIYY